MDKSFRDFIIAHAEDDCDKLLLGKAKWPDIDVPSAVNCIISRRKIRVKLPEWYAVEDLFYPNTLSAEQCSGEAAAAYKVAVIACKSEGEDFSASVNGMPDLSGLRIADLTGGLGADSRSFAKAGARVLYNEMDPSIYAAACHNFPLLGVSPLCRNRELSPESLDDILGDFRPDVIFLDPARRSVGGSKVFRLEDCSPDLGALIVPLLKATPRVIAKISPMADITSVCRRLISCAGFPCIERVHVTGSAGECKELLLDLRRIPCNERNDISADAPAHLNQADCGGELSVNSGTELSVNISVSDYRHGRRSNFSFNTADERAAAVRLAQGAEDLEGGLLFEPCSALMKAGPYKLLCSEQTVKAGISTHIYFSRDKDPRLEGLGQYFRIIQALPLDKRSMRLVASEWPRAEVSAKNIPMSSDELRKRLSVRPGEKIHIFGIRCEFKNSPSGNFLLVTERE